MPHRPALEAPRTPRTQRRKTARSVVLVDRFAKGAITAGGVGIIAAVLGILLFILTEALPLLVGGEAEPVAAYAPPAPHASGISAPDSDVWTAWSWRPPVLLGSDEYRELGYLTGASGALQLFRPATGEPVRTIPLAPNSVRITSAAEDAEDGLVVLASEDGRLFAGHLAFDAEYEAETRTSVAEWHPDSVRTLSGAGAIVQLAAVEADEQIVFAAVRAGKNESVDGRPGRQTVLVRVETVESGLFGGGTRTVSEYDLSAEVAEPVTALAFSGDGDQLFAGTANGRVYRFDVEPDAAPVLQEVLAATDGPAVTALSVLLGDASLVVGTATGQVSTWFAVPEPSLGPSVRPFRRIRDFEPHTAAITSIAASPRNKAFVTADANGSARMQHNTTARILFDLPSAEGPVLAAALSPKFDGLLVYRPGRLSGYDIDAPHPEVTLTTLFGKVWYEGYSEPDFVWQSTGGTDEFEGKFSLMPLIFGTLKGTFYALLFAVPVALLAAVYTSQFMPDRLKQIIKPTVEIMAALPSVVLGFLAGLYLAPRMETMIPAIFLFLVALPAVLIGGALAWDALPHRWVRRLPAGAEMALLIPLVLLAFWISRELGPGFEEVLFGGDFREWLSSNSSGGYDQRNCIVVGFAMGFAVIPIIFTICEDSFSAVPGHLISGSMACGASRWQTAMQIVLPAAGSGIFSAIMIGFGRAVGETMIVLMATGNTPIMDWSIFNGMRTLSANIAVEMPEAPYRGTLYRILFLAGLLLLILTSVINTAAELVRLRLKRKFGNY